MSIVPVKATEAARRFSEILNRVKYQGHSFEVKRGREIVARIVPAGPSRSLKVSDLGKVFEELPRLEETERRALQKDLRSVRKKAAGPENPWA